MSQELKHNIIDETARLIIGGEKEFNDYSREMKDMLIWYLRYDQANTLGNIAIKLRCERNTVSASIKRSIDQRALQLEREGVNLYTEFVKFQKGIELIKDRALAKDDLGSYISALNLYMNELRRCGFIKDNAGLPVKFELNINNANVIVGQIMELFSAIPTERLKEIGDIPTAKHKKPNNGTKH